MPQALVDSHAHLTDERLWPDVGGVVARARDAGVAAIVCVATSADGSDAVLGVSERFPEVYATAGIHPHQASTASEENLSRVRVLLENPRVVAVGETGLDYHYDYSPREAQRRSLERHLEFSRELGKPVIVHAREADEDLLAILRAAGGGTSGVLHSYSSGRALLEEALALGWYASFSGMVTFKRFDGADLVRLVPADRIMVETDSPYLAPVPHRGKTNEPAFVAHIAARAAAIRGEDPVDFAGRTTENARRFFGIPVKQAIGNRQ